jgi:hypothetical protein
MSALAFPGLAIESPLVAPEAKNFRPSSWPPARDWPVVLDAEGRVICRWGDSKWVLDAWAGKRCVLNFGDGPDGCKASPIDGANADLLRTVVGWWLYGSSGVRAAKSLQIRFSTLRPLFALCSEEGILASDLGRYPLVADKLHSVFMPASSDVVLSLLHELLSFSSDVGFELLGARELAKLAAALPDHEGQQTAYIPPRIWKYQAGRLRECLDDFLENKAKVEGLFQFCLDAYVHNYGSLEAATSVGKDSNKRPFNAAYEGQHRKGRIHPGAFEESAAKFGVADLLTKWVGVSSSARAQTLTVDMLASYLTLVNLAGIGYVLNFTLMRGDEAMAMKSGCLTFDDDPRFGRMYLIESETSKTVSDDTAHWVTSESSTVAVEAMTAIAALRRKCLASTTDDRLLQHPTEPWSAGISAHDVKNRQRPVRYAALIERFPLLLDAEQLRITPRDLELARLATPTLDSSYQVGTVWPLAWHQLRRTGAVNMQASGLVSDASLQFQLKHLSRAMSLYYGQNHAQVHLEESARAVYVQAMYETLGRELQNLASERFVSPHGVRRKEELVRLISVDDLKQSLQLAKRGGVACREIILGACMNKEPCPYGGVDSVAHCGGGDSGKPCSEVLYDRSKATQVARLDRLLDERLNYASSGSPMHEALSAQKRSVQNYLSATQASR